MHTLYTVIENREAEITDLTKQLALQKSEVEKSKRQIEEMRRDQDNLQLGLTIFISQSIIFLNFLKQIF